jgi:hypothetical protein
MAAADEAIERKFERKLSPREMLKQILPPAYLTKEVVFPTNETKGLPASGMDFGCHFCGAHSPTIVVGGFDLCEECKEYY